MVTLYLVSILEPEADGEVQRQQKESDKGLVQAVLKSMEELSQGGKDVVATQSVSVIKSLLAVESPNSTFGCQTANLKLTIPYFGTISIVRPPPPAVQTETNIPYLQQLPQQSLAMGQQLPRQAWQGPFTPHTPGLQSPTKQPMISFMSSQFPEFSCQAPELLLPEQQQQIQNWSLPEDNLFFDSLTQTDLEGNWIF